MKNKLLFTTLRIKTAITIMGIGLLLVGCSSSAPTAQPAAAVPTATNEASSATAQANTAANSTLKDACTILTAKMIKDITGVEYAEGVTKPSNINGSTCIFKTAEPKHLFNTLILQIGVGKEYYMGTLYPADVPSAGIGDKSFIKGPDSGSTNIGALKGNIVVSITMFDDVTAYTSDQVKALLKAVVDQL